MNKVLIGALGTVGVVAVLGVVTLFSGIIDVGADTPHSPAVYRLIEFARERAIDRSASDITPPTDLSDNERIRRGAGNYDAMCAGCHLSPGVDNSEIRQGLYPIPPNLARPEQIVRDGDRSLSRQFWIIKHGIKASGMPAWSKGGMEDAAIWDLVALLQKMPTITPEQYRQLVDTSEGHSHGGLDDHHAHEDKQPSLAKETPTKVRKPAHDHSGHKHAH